MLFTLSYIRGPVPGKAMPGGPVPERRHGKGQGFRSRSRSRSRSPRPTAGASSTKPGSPTDSPKGKQGLWKGSKSVRPTAVAPPPPAARPLLPRGASAPTVQKAAHFGRSLQLGSKSGPRQPFGPPPDHVIAAAKKPSSAAWSTYHPPHPAPSAEGNHQHCGGLPERN